jgi:hypothetical protein
MNVKCVENNCKKTGKFGKNGVKFPGFHGKFSELPCKLLELLGTVRKCPETFWKLRVKFSSRPAQFPARPAKLLQSPGKFSEGARALARFNIRFALNGQAA